MTNSYSKGSDASTHDKQLSMKPMTGASAHGGGDGTGPTRSARSYAKGSKLTLSADFNPQKCKATDWAVGGV